MPSRSTARSTARHISYDLRPCKQTERRILVDVLKLGTDIGLPIREYKYIGMGANRFYDFIMAHRDLGITKMISLEHDIKMFQRANYNCPFNFIEVINEKTASYLSKENRSGPEILWLDYDGAISRDVVSDIRTIGDRARPGDFAFITVYGEAPQWAVNLTATQTKTGFEERFGELASVLDVQELDDRKFDLSILKMLSACFSNAFAQRLDGRFQKLFNISYSDSVRMVTYGGAFLPRGTASGYTDRINAALPFLRPTKAQPYHLPSFHYTDKERVLFDRAATSPTRRPSKERKTLSSFGFTNSDIEQYGELIRYIPRYVESAI